jgi:hypothetical protein
MDVKTLNTYTKLKARYIQLEQEILDIQAHYWSGSVRSSMPAPSFAQTYTRVEGCPPEQAQQLCERRKEKHSIGVQLREMECYIANIDDPRRKTICELHFFQGKSWSVASGLAGYDSLTAATSDIYRYVK